MKYPYSLLRAFLLGSCTASNLNPFSSASGIVDVGYVKYAGDRILPNVVAYLGIPYAEPPVANLRFRAPVTLNTSRVAQSASGGLIYAKDYPEFCIQGATSASDRGGSGSEDCLKLNVYTPGNATRNSRLPVLVYIHGGGYVYGNPANWPFEHWIEQSPNVVIVSVYYRLSAFGFLSALSFENSISGDYNAGFQDQIMALKWIQTHISSFGGDPSQVTINGESAGGSSVELHLVANEGKSPLFARAIAQSVYRTPLPTPRQQEPLFNAFATLAGCADGSELHRIGCLRTASVSTLAMAQDAAASSTDISYHSFHPVLDGRIITDLPTRSTLAGKSVQVPLIVGATSNETLSGSSDISTALEAFFPALTSDDMTQLLGRYPASSFSSAAEQFRTATGESELRCARSLLAGTYSKRRLTTWAYRYDQPNPTSSSLAVEHAAENWMMFQGTNTGPNGTTTFTAMNTIQQAFAAELIAYWLSFVRSGDPNTFKLERSPIWKRYKSDSRNRLVLREAGPETGSSGSVMEEEPTTETTRCTLVGSPAQNEHQQN